MIAADRDALVCDLAETYGIYDMRALPVSTLAVLASGLRDNSRIKMKLSGMKTDRETLLMAMAVDNLRFLSWTKTKAAQDGKNRPKSIAGALMQVEEQPQHRTFRSGQDFTAEWNRLRGGDGNG